MRDAALTSVAESADTAALFTGVAREYLACRVGGAMTMLHEQRFAQWTLTDVAQLRRIWPGAQFGALGDTPFAATITRRRLTTVAIEGIDATPYAVRRGVEDIARIPRGDLLLNAVVEGWGSVSRGSLSFSVEPGDVFLLRPDQPFEYQCPVATRTFRATVDEDLLPPNIRGRYAPPLEVLPRTGVIRAFVSLASDLLECEPNLAPSRVSTAHLDAAVTALEQGVLAEVLASHPVSTERNDQLRLSILEYIETHLRDVRLGPRALAETFRISLRTLHNLFEPLPETVAGRIRRRRIEEAAAILRTRDMAAAELAGELGFSSADSFHRAFRLMQGVTPAQYRALRRRLGE